MKKIFWVAGVVFLFSCNSGDPVAKKKQQLVKYKEQVVRLNLKINQIKEELGADTVVSGIARVPVRVKQMTPEAFDHFIEVSGTVKPEQEAFLSPEINGIIEKIYVNEGDFVQKGTLLFRLNSSLTESSIAETKTQLDLAKALYLKQKRLWSQGVGSEVQYLQTKTNYEATRNRLKTLQTQLDMARIKAPFDGFVDQIMIREGELAAPGRQLALLVNLSHMKIYARVSEQFLNDIHTGDPAEVVFPDLEGKTLNLNLFRVGNTINEKSRDFQIEIKFENPGNIIKPNQFAMVRLNDFHSDLAMVVPSEIIKQDLKGYFLYTLGTKNGDQVAIKKYISPGIFYNNTTLVTDGLSPEDKVVVAGYNQISDGQIVTVNNE